ncbi:TetR/AcrR family transcriptional regulator [Deinococcus aquiradiocola]|uniref:TetR family transcriptional regulator n=1 Tax=Deinococcus aquiradiocola TaxID=393059 RepID=A0A917PB73_9DEIO|nr:TetR/AcrR family transcriptional regulator [Deinococcus aquiradiocola]GGJ69553.1 TetR family transcriptional regulator [Deinococcus aquiradiocola]
MPRYAPQHREHTRERILDAASRAYLRAGLSGVSVQSVMQDAGLTHGGFYAHFENRDALVAAALERSAFRKHAALVAHARTHPHPLAALVRAYLSRQHRDHPDDGCPLPALSADVSRAQDPLRRTFAQGLTHFTQSVLGLQPDLTPAQAQTLVAALVGTLLLARALPDREASDALLHGARHTLIKALPPAPPGPAPA